MSVIGKGPQRPSSDGVRHSGRASRKPTAPGTFAADDSSAPGDHDHSPFDGHFGGPEPHSAADDGASPRRPGLDLPRSAPAHPSRPSSLANGAPREPSARRASPKRGTSSARALFFAPAAAADLAAAEAAPLPASLAMLSPVVAEGMPLGSNGRLVAPAEALARFVGLLQRASTQGADPTLSSWADRALTAYLEQPGQLSTLTSLHAACLPALRAQGHSELAHQCERVVASALRDPTPTLAQLQAILSTEQAKLPSEQAQNMAALIGEVDAARRSLPDFASAPAASMQAASSLLRRCQAEVNLLRSPFVQAKAVLQQRADATSEKLFQLATLANKQAEQSIAKFAMDRARLRLDDAKRQSDTLRTWLGSPTVPLGLLAAGARPGELAERAAAVDGLLHFCSQEPAQTQERVITLLRARRTKEADYAAFPGGAYAYRFVHQLSTGDLQAMAGSLQHGASLTEACGQWHLATTAASTEPMTLSLRSTMASYRAALLARAPLQARAMLDRDDALEGVDNKIADLASQLAPTSAERNDALHQRAYETLLVTRLIAACPESTKTSWTLMGKAMQARIAELATGPESKAMASAGKQFRKKMLSRGQRPWDAMQPAIQLLLRQAADSSLGDGQFLEAATQLIASPATTGYDVVGKANIIREMWLSLAAASIAPNQARTNKEYLDLYAQKKDMRLAVALNSPGAASLASGATAPRAAFGIMGLHQPLPEAQPAALAATQPGLTHAPNLEAPGHQDALALSGAIISGNSGSTNMLLSFFDWAQTNGKAALQAHHHRDIALGAVQFLAQDGGHSISEVLYVMDTAMGGKYALSTSGRAPQGLAHLRAAFADEPAVQEAFRDSALAMARFDEQLAARTAPASAAETA